MLHGEGNSWVPYSFLPPLNNPNLLQQKQTLLSFAFSAPPSRLSHSTGSCALRLGGDKGQPVKVRCHSQENTHASSALGDLSKLWAHRRGGLLLKASEIKLFSLAIFNPPMVYILSCCVGGMGRRERDGGKGLAKPAILKPMEWGLHDTGQRCRQTLASASTPHT